MLLFFFLQALSLLLANSVVCMGSVILILIILLSTFTQQYTRETTWPFSHTTGHTGFPVLQIHVAVDTPVQGSPLVVPNGQTAGVKSSGSIVPGDREE